MDGERGEWHRLYDIIPANLSWNIYDGYDVGGVFALPYSTLELVAHSIQHLAYYLLEMAQILGIALRRYIAHLDICDDWFGSLGTYTGRLEPYIISSNMDADCC